MKNLSRNEVIELRAEAIYRALPFFEYDEETGEGFALSYEAFHDAYIGTDKFDDLVKQAQATIEADEKAGVLMLVEEGEFCQEGDIGLNELNTPAEFSDYYGNGFMFYTNEGEPINGCKVIHRANTPVYQCKKEGAE